jgi:hypothetical protein
MARLTAVLGAALLLAAAAPVWAVGTGRTQDALRFLPGLTAEEAQGVEAVADCELAEMRGRYAGYYFSADMSGYWDSLGNQNALLATDTNISVNEAPPPEGPSTDLSDPSIPDVRIHAFVGSIQNTSGLIQITQVPGSNNVITSVMNLKIMVINVPNGSSDLAKLLPKIAGF